MLKSTNIKSRQENKQQLSLVDDLLKSDDDEEKEIFFKTSENYVSLNEDCINLADTLPEQTIQSDKTELDGQMESHESLGKYIYANS